MNATYNASFTFALLAFGLLSIVQINFDQLSYATICFDCPDANFHLDEAKKSIDNGDYSGAKNHIDQANEMTGQHNSHSITNGLNPTNATNGTPQ